MLARRALEQSAAARAEAGIRKVLASHGIEARAEALIAGLAGAVDREGALLRLWRFCEAADPALCASVDPLLLGTLFSHTDSLSERLIASPETAAWLPEALGPAPSRAELLARLGPPEAEPAALAKQLRRFRHRAYIRLALRDLLSLDDIPGLTREISLVAEAVLEGALAGVSERLDREIGPPLAPREDGTLARCGFVVLGMGKLGGEELNYSSDIDLIYAYETDEGRAGKGSLHDYFKRLAELLTKAVSEVTEDGLAFRVDLRLRPEGTRGALVNSLRSLESYYEAFGRTWERAALLKARPVAGDLALGETILRALEPYIYRRSLDLRQLNEIRDLNREIKRDLHRKGGPTWDVKLGRGGIREVEFFVQALQLVYAGREPRLRERGTLRALTRLLYAGRLSAREHSWLREAYLVYRRVEHRIQLWRERQTHALPAAPEDLARLARGLGFASPADFSAAIEAHRAKVSQIFETLFHDAAAPSALASGALSEAPEVEVLLARGNDRQARIEALSALSFGEPEAAERMLAALERVPLSPFSPSAPPELAGLAGGLLAEAARSPDPDKALVHLTGFLRQAGGAYLQLFLQNPTLGRLLLHLFGTSDLLSDAFVRDPGLLEVLLSAGRAELRRGAPRMAELAARRVAPHAEREDRLRALRRFYREETLRIALHDIGGELDWLALQAELSDLAEVLVRACFAEAQREDEEARGPGAAPMCVVGLGKLGGRELGYKSDLDLIFLYEGSPLEVERCAKIAQRAIFFLSARLEEGGLYEIDTRLRPSGRQGALVASLEGFARYHGEGEGANGQRGQLWEEQALLRARPVAGEEALQARAAALFARLGQRPRDPGTVRQELRRVRRRMEEEIPRRGTFHLKASAGGMVDIEFIAQGLQLLHGAAHPEVLGQNTRAALTALAQAGHIPAEQERSLVDDYAFLWRLSSRVRLLYDQGIDELRDSPQALRGVARSLGLSSPEALQEELSQRRRRVREGFDALLPPIH